MEFDDYTPPTINPILLLSVLPVCTVVTDGLTPNWKVRQGIQACASVKRIAEEFFLSRWRTSMSEINRYKIVWIHCVEELSRFAARKAPPWGWFFSSRYVCMYYHTFMAHVCQYSYKLMVGIYRAFRATSTSLKTPLFFFFFFFHLTLRSHSIEELHGSHTG